MNVRFYIDPETEAPHIHKHGIDEEEVVDVLESRRGPAGSGRVARSNRKDTSRTLFAGDLCSRSGTGKCIRDYSVRVVRKAVVRLSKTLT